MKKDKQGMYKTWPATTPCTVMGEDDALVSDTVTCSSTCLLYASHMTIQIACPKYPESKDRVLKSFSFIPCFQARPTMLCASV